MNDTIREALRRAPVKYGPYTLEPHSAFASGWRWQAEDRRVCLEFDARNAMIAAWVEALTTRGYGPMFHWADNTYFIVSLNQSDSGDDENHSALSGPTILGALAAAINEVMPEVTT